MRRDDPEPLAHRGFLLGGLGLLVLLAGVVAWQVAGRPRAQVTEKPVTEPGVDGPVTRSAGGDSPTRRPAARPPAARTEKPSDREPLPPPDAPHDVAIAQLRPLANAGRTDAMRTLASELHDCHVADHGDDAEIRQHSIDQILRLERDMHGGRKVENETEWVESQTTRLIALRDECARVDADEAARWLDWLDRAASAGDTDAMIAYAGMALLDPRAQPDAWSAEEVARRKARAGDYLQKALEGGNCGALMAIERAYDADSGSGIFEPDPAMAYAIATARWAWYRENHADEADPEITQGWLDYLARAQAKVAEDQRAAASQRGEDIYARYCRGRPES